jgi:hypothetical protein
LTETLLMRMNLTGAGGCSASTLRHRRFVALSTRSRGDPKMGKNVAE